jgi:phage/plasmid-like protein (TIGR03299 family)
MAHELEQLSGGRTAFVSARQPAWHQLGTITQECMTADEIMTRAFLGGWKVRKISLHGEEIIPTGVTRIDCPDKWMTVRSNIDTGETEYLGVVGEDYTPVQNEQVAEMLDRLVDAAGGAHFETAGSLRGGRRVFVTMKLPKGMRIAGVDDMDLYLAATTSHDGTAGLRVDATPVRIVCANTDRAALARTKGFYVFRHTTNVHSQIAQAREAMGLMWDYFDEFQRAAERMINETLTMGEFEKVVEKLWPLPEDASEPTKRNHRQRQAALRYLVRDADTQKAIRDTRWAGYQAITEYVDHYAPAKTIELRANRAVAGPGAELKSRAFELLTV